MFLRLKKSIGENSLLLYFTIFFSYTLCSAQLFQNLQEHTVKYKFP